MSDTLEIFGVEYSGVEGIIATDDNGNELTYTRGGGSPTLQTKGKTYTPTTSQQTETVQADVGYDGLEKVNITVNAMTTGTAGTPSITQTTGTSSVTLTPTVTNTTGYITGSTKTGTAVTINFQNYYTGSSAPSSSLGNNGDIYLQE